MTLLQLEVFVAVVEAGSFTKAGEKLNLSQSGVSHAIAGLEAELGISLLTRSRSGVSLTEAGEAVLVHAREVLNRLEQIRQSAAAAAGLQIGTLRVGSFPSVSAKLLPGLLRLFRDRYPGIELTLFEGSYPEIRAWIQAGAVDAAFFPYPEEGLEIVPLLEDELVVVVPDGHPCSSRSELTVGEIAAEPFIMPKAGCEVLVEAAFVNHGYAPNTRFEVADTATILAMVREGLGITVVPRLTLPDSVPGLHVCPLAPRTCRQIGLAVRSLQSPSPAAAAFLKEAQAWVNRQFRAKPMEK
ncbi:LysR family transcriptional regulator [Brevibacillus sp. SYP-B805]|uniref:LysR family transcriptional regulator n=1 Tax=Brevibacillus sp. SYP-B805 TaxID=1578199 RepID=UPI0013EDBB49|nr:LysR family transcriptional regulator [Brevibacillus sp. SYP-B805]NGQ94387.1 LysR family transcriptional regulator [Brevibacillus sp. SYP-B805]